MRTTFPFITLGKIVLYDGKEFTVNGVDHTQQTFDIIRIKETPNTVVHGLPFYRYKPAPVRSNFEAMLEEWDYYANMSDDERVVDEHRDKFEKIVDLFNAMQPDDKLHYRKILAVISHAKEDS